MSLEAKFKAKFDRVCDGYAELTKNWKAQGIPPLYLKNIDMRRCVEMKIKEKIAKRDAISRVQHYDPIAWSLIQKYPVISDANLRQKIREKLPGDSFGQSHVFSLVRSRSYKATAFAGAQLKSMTKFMEASTQENQDTHRRHLETLPKIQAASEMNNRKRALFKKLNARHASLRAHWTTRKKNKKI